jgi:hypothetical protein
MKAAREPLPSRNSVQLSHNFIVGPLSNYEPLGQIGRIYYCSHCKWSFLVCGRKIAAMDGDGQAITGEEGLRRFQTFAAGPCPALEKLITDGFVGTIVPAPFGNGAGRLALHHGNPRSSALRKLARLLFRFGKQSLSLAFAKHGNRHRHHRITS